MQTRQFDLPAGPLPLDTPKYLENLEEFDLLEEQQAELLGSQALPGGGTHVPQGGKGHCAEPEGHGHADRPVYARYVEAPDWGVSLRKGHHQALISLETFQKIQERLKGHPKAPARKNLNLDFPLRGLLPVQIMAIH